MANKPFDLGVRLFDYRFLLGFSFLLLHFGIVSVQVGLDSHVFAIEGAILGRHRGAKLWSTHHQENVGGVPFHNGKP